MSNTSQTSYSSDDDVLHRSSALDDHDDMYEPVESRDSADEAAAELEELDLDGNPIYHDEDDLFDYPDTEKQFGEVVVVMKHIQKGTRPQLFLPQTVALPAFQCCVEPCSPWEFDAIPIC